ncbi:MAG: (deoxy)nucleoside triphosphate pyrophosphohydrolase [Syntrophorhabdales bacterium]|jgi:8-oxo-dGTP diphosphatase
MKEMTTDRRIDYIKVAAAIIEKEGKILIGRRKAGRFADMWEFPGGKIEPDETPEECLKRELHEELGIEAVIGEFFLSSRYRYSHAAIELLTYRAEIVAGGFTLHDHKEIRWVPAPDLPSYDFPAADRPVVARLIEEGRARHRLVSR